jgi:hypothetical protein
LEFFANQRTANSKGVTIPSQLRYVKYFENFLKDYHWASPPRPFNFNGHPIILTGFKLSPKADFDSGGGCDPYFKILKQDGTLIYNYKKSNKVREWRKEPFIELKCRV